MITAPLSLRGPTLDHPPPSRGEVKIGKLSHKNAITQNLGPSPAILKSPPDFDSWTCMDPRPNVCAIYLISNKLSRLLIVLGSFLITFSIYIAIALGFGIGILLVDRNQ